jgi:hypothetical protein
MRHLNYFYTKDVDGLVANDYMPDAELVTVDFAVKGSDALKQTFHAYLDMVGDIKLMSTDHFQETDDVIQLEATMDTSKAGIRRVYDVFVMKDGKIAYHITGVK